MLQIEKFWNIAWYLLNIKISAFRLCFNSSKRPFLRMWILQKKNHSPYNTQVSLEKTSLHPEWKFQILLKFIHFHSAYLHKWALGFYIFVKRAPNVNGKTFLTSIFNFEVFSLQQTATLLTVMSFYKHVFAVNIAPVEIFNTGRIRNIFQIMKTFLAVNIYFIYARCTCYLYRLHINFKYFIS